MSASGENEKGISQLEKCFGIRLSRDEGVRVTDYFINYCFYYSYYIAG